MRLGVSAVIVRVHARHIRSYPVRSIDCVEPVQLQCGTFARWYFSRLWQRIRATFPHVLCSSSGSTTHVLKREIRYCAYCHYGSCLRPCGERMSGASFLKTFSWVRRTSSPRSPCTHLSLEGFRMAFDPTTGKTQRTGKIPFPPFDPSWHFSCYFSAIAPRVLCPADSSNAPLVSSQASPSEGVNHVNVLTAAYVTCGDRTPWHHP